MKPRLLTIHGPLKGTVFNLGNDDVSIGRGADNQVSIPDLNVSRRHCVVRRQGDQFLIRDLESTNGTLVNGIPVKERVLTVGDQIAVADSVLLYDWFGESQEASPGGGALLEAEPTVNQSRFQITAEETSSIQRDGLQLDHLPAERLRRDLNALLRINSLLGSIRSLDPLREQLLELIFRHFPAQHGAIVYAAEDGSNCTVNAVRSGEGAADEFRPSRTILETVLKKRTPLLSNDILADPALAGADSLMQAGVRAVLCVPLPFSGPRAGVIYLENRDAGAVFDADHLRLLTAIAGTAAGALENAEELERLTEEYQRLKGDLAADQNMLGRSPAMQRVFDLIARVAPSDSTVLIIGESGTGKELAARAIHRNSPRAARPFLAVNCAILTDELLGSELFGHEKGAFTGAVSRKKGKLELADSGTVLLDEVGELAPELQAKLLRFLQEREFERVGGNQPIRVDVRIIASTNRNLERAIEENRFRSDLYYRLNVVSLPMPPLRDRADDVLLLARHFLNRFGARCNRRLKGFSAAAGRCLKAYSWPGNVRELQNAIERAVVMSADSLILPEDLPDTVRAPTRFQRRSPRFHEQVAHCKRELISDALRKADGNLTRAARSLGIHRTYLHRLIKNLGIRQKGDE